MESVASSRFRIGAFQLAVLTPVPSLQLISRTDVTPAWGPPWGFMTRFTAGDPCEARLLELGVFDGPPVAPTETTVKRVFSAHHQAFEGRIKGVARLADAVCDLARVAGLEGIRCVQIPLAEDSYRIEIAFEASAFAWQIGDHASTYSVAAILNAICLHCDLDRLFSVEDEASIVWGPLHSMLRAYPVRDCGLHALSDELPDDWFEYDADEADEGDELRDVYPPGALTAADLRAISRGVCPADDVVARAITRGEAALTASYPGRRFEGINDDGCLLPAIIFRAVPTAAGLETIDLATARELDADAQVGDELVVRITRRFIPLLARPFPELDFARTFAVWNGATAQALAREYAPRMLEPLAHHR